MSCHAQILLAVAALVSACGPATGAVRSDETVPAEPTSPHENPALRQQVVGCTCTSQSLGWVQQHDGAEVTFDLAALCAVRESALRRLADADDPSVDLPSPDARRALLAEVQAGACELIDGGGVVFEPFEHTNGGTAAFNLIHRRQEGGQTHLIWIESDPGPDGWRVSRIRAEVLRPR